MIWILSRGPFIILMVQVKKEVILTAVNIRQLTVSDSETLRDLIRKMVNATGETALVNLKPKKGDDVGEEKQEGESIAQIAELAFSIFSKMLDVISEDVHAWFADLLCISVDEFKRLPFDTEMKVVEAIINDECFKSFFSTGSRVLRSIKSFGNPLNYVKKLLNTKED